MGFYMNVHSWLLKKQIKKKKIMPWTINYNPNHTLDQQELLAYCGPTTTSTYCGSPMATPTILRTTTKYPNHTVDQREHLAYCGPTTPNRLDHQWQTLAYCGPPTTIPSILWTTSNKPEHTVDHRQTIAYCGPPTATTNNTVDHQRQPLTIP